MHNPFKKMDLEYSSPQKKKKTPARPAPPSEDELFSRAMQGVSPLAGRGRDVAPKPAPVHNIRTFRPPEKTFNELLATSIEFDLESTHAFTQGHIKGLDQKIFRKLKGGSLSIGAHLDLHGHTESDARLALFDFMRGSYMEGKRCVLVIPGRGKNSPLGMGVLRQGVQSWLTQDPIKRIVLAFCTAQPKHGGAGALYVLLRKNKKGRGKIMWDKLVFDK
ncbi:Smr/MutS family protein [Desulfoplanes sp.]